MKLSSRFRSLPMLRLEGGNGRQPGGEVCPGVRPWGAHVKPECPRQCPRSPWQAVKRVLSLAQEQKTLACEVARAVISRLRDGDGPRPSGKCPMKASMVLAVALATGLLGSFRVVAEAAPACLGGRFLVEGPPLISATPDGEPDAVVIDGISIFLTSGCGSTSGKMTLARTGTKVNAVWPSCDGLRGKVRGLILPAER